ncbi:MAG: L-aspartate oxidase [Planctomycetes bacterium]|nr:L-aspartate oxidase [Planctomycetota bacterium]
MLAGSVTDARLNDVAAMPFSRSVQCSIPVGVSKIETDVLVIGTGIAGLSAALAASEHGRVLVVCKGELHDSNTRYAQGGIAVPTQDPRDIEAHIEDTLRVACGLADLDIVKYVIQRAPAAVEKLITRGMAFDREGGMLARTREGGHSRSRVLHARGDATGLELGATLAKHVHGTPNIHVIQFCMAEDLMTCDGRCTGAMVWLNDSERAVIRARTTIIATGGTGGIFLHTTNPLGATADGTVMALRAGAVLASMEFMQFHPTALHVGIEPMPLVSEALRGEGARLVDAGGRRFMSDYHSDGELAPRDVVSRAIVTELRRARGDCVFLDVRHWPTDFMSGRFPNVYKTCRGNGIDPAHQLVPVRPAAHYMIGGVRVDRHGRSSLDGLFACGEASCTGMHGANRLASNSLLEALVLAEVCGQAAAQEAMSEANPAPRFPDHGERSPARSSNSGPNAIAAWRRRIREASWEYVGMIRSGTGISAMQALIEDATVALSTTHPCRSLIELRNIITAAAMIAFAAAMRTESRGVHYREDHPQSNDAQLKQIELCLVDGHLTGNWSS